ncbi:SPOR domain-containing protein [Algirhabdus cladophorae]|uniref:SPOR domain-containing protein n=1 Tax=Algirhabdus cladophorae TaxID=3377108 RepID=UPI003B84840B
MRIIKTLSAALILGISMGSGASAQTLRSVGEPAEFPPASFTPNQYVDSRGCVYIRAGISGNTTWVPRVARNRTAVCGFQPSLSATAQATPEVTAPKVAPAAPAAKPAPAPAATQIATAPVKPAAAPKPAPAKVAAPKVVKKPVVKVAPKPVRKVAQAAPKPVAKPVEVVVAPVARTVVQSPPKTVVRRPFFAGLFGQRPMDTVASIKAAPTTRPVGLAPKVAQPQVKKVVRTAPTRPAVTRSASGCTNASAFSQQYINSGQVSPVRCGPQEGLPYTPGPGRAVVQAPVQAAPAVAPVAKSPAMTRKVAAAQSQKKVRVLRNPPVPEGYRKAWSDDRLSNRRAQTTAEGNAAMNLIWTQEVPRRLIDSTTGRDVTRFFPKLRFPYISMNAQQRDLGTRISTKTIKPSTPKVVKKPKKVVAKAAPRKPAQAAKGRYVQIGTFGNAANVDKNVRRLKASGLPVRVANITSKGRKLQVVLAGPFQSPNRLNSALRALRGAGYKDAFVR